MKTQLRKSIKGFTIIEVMIVLAIAGLIMAIIFLAVPALQRNTHNNSRRSDASHLAGLVNEYAANHAGTLPPNLAAMTAAGGVCAAENFAIITANCGSVSILPAAAVNTAGTLTNMVIYTGALCNASTNVVSSTTAARSFSIEYKIESSGGGAGTDTCLQG